MGTRSKARKRAIDILYEADLRDMDAQEVLADRVGSIEVAVVREYTVTLVEGVVRRRRRIDDVLIEHSEGWTLGRMPAVDRAVLRLGLYELIWGEDVPNAVAIDEAVELVKSLSTDDSPKFVNGVLGRVAGMSDRLRESAQEAGERADGAPDDASDDDVSATETSDDPDSSDDGVSQNERPDDASDDVPLSDGDESEDAVSGGETANNDTAGTEVSASDVPTADAKTADAKTANVPEAEENGHEAGPPPSDGGRADPAGA